MLESFPPGFQSVIKVMNKTVKSNSLESKFSKSVYSKRVPPEEKNDLTTDYRKIIDRRKQSAQINLVDKNKLRLKSINDKGKVISELYYNQVDLNDKPTKIRIKSVAQENQYGIKETDWVVYDKNVYERKAKSLNQYRVKAFSSNYLESKWVYSELINDKNEEILFSLLTDFLDIALSMQDDDLEYSVELATQDYFTKEIMDYLPEYLTTLPLDERLRVKYSEIFKLADQGLLGQHDDKILKLTATAMMINQRLPKCIEESKELHRSELIDIYRSYVLNDSLVTNINNENVDGLLLEILEDAYKLLLLGDDNETLLYNKEETHALLQTVFDFKAQGDHLDALLMCLLNDNIIDLTKDALKLIVESSFIESHIKDFDEDSTIYVQKVLSSIYTLLFSTDSIYREMLSYVDDEYGVDIIEDIVNYYLYDENNTITGMEDMPKDLLKLYVIDSMQMDVNAEFIDSFANLLSDKGFKALVAFMHEEVLDMLITVETSIETNPNYKNKEELILGLSESNDVFKKIMNEIKEQTCLSIKDFHEIKRKQVLANDESKGINIFDSAINEYLDKKLHFEEQVKLMMNEFSAKESIDEMAVVDELVTTFFKENFGQVLKNYTQYKETTNINFSDFTKKVLTIIKNRLETFKIIPDDHVDYLWLGNPKERIPEVMKDFREIFLTIDRMDSIPDWMLDTVQYSTGSFETDYPVGKFVVGKNSIGRSEELTK